MMRENKFIFIDRDGVINRDGWGVTEYGYILNWQDWHFIPGVLEAFRLLKEAGYGTVVVSNQKCVAKKLITRKELDKLTDNFVSAVEAAGGEVSGVYYCPHRDEDNCSCRKPRPGLFEEAKKDLGIGSFSGMYMIGDSERDMEAGRRAGLKTILVLSGKAAKIDAEKWRRKPDYIFKDLLAAARFIVKGG